MAFAKLLAVLFVAGAIATTCESQDTRPNVVIIFVDDMGWNDVSYHGSDQFYTPNIDMLAYSGITLNRYYTHCLCTPSRAALQTGKYAYRTGMHGIPITSAENRTLPLTEKLLPEYFKELDYATHLVGKWHLGHALYEYLPTFRGYDTHYGHQGGWIDYYEYTRRESITGFVGDLTGLDLYRNVTPDWTAEGYITDIFSAETVRIIEEHDESQPLFLTIAHNAPHAASPGALLQAPEDTVRSMRHVANNERRIFAAMMKKLDDSVGDLIEALDNKGILDNTIIMFMSDNGGYTTGSQPINYGSNWPLRGLKGRSWEGGIRVGGIVWSANHNNTNHFWDGYMHVTDVLPTLLGAVGAEAPEGIDGINQWEAINENQESERDVIFELDGYYNFSIVISGDYKLLIGGIDSAKSSSFGGDLRGIIGTPPSYSDALTGSKAYAAFENINLSVDVSDLSVREKSVIDCNNKTFVSCVPDQVQWCLYNIKEDPCEMEEISATYPDIAQELYDMIMAEQSSENTVRPSTQIYDFSAAPACFNYTWSSFLQPEAGNTCDDTITVDVDDLVISDPNLLS